MKFSRKPRNRRLGREQVLDVKLRPSQVRASRNRIGMILLLVISTLGLGGLGIWKSCQWAFNRCFYQNPDFAILDLQIRNEGVIPIDQLQRWSGVQRGDNLLRLDLARVKRDLEQVSLIQSVSIERILPHTLRIQVTERLPIAQVNLPRPIAGGGVEYVVFQLDAEGVVIVPPDPRQRITTTNQAPDALPLVSGLKPVELQPGRRLEDPQALAALELVWLFDHSSMAEVVDLRRVDVSAPGVLLATTGQGGEITFALIHLDQQLRRWREIHDLGQRRSKVVATLDLAVTNNIPARWVDSSAAPPPPVRVIRPSRNAKKHV